MSPSSWRRSTRCAMLSDGSTLLPRRRCRRPRPDPPHLAIRTMPNTSPEFLYWTQMLASPSPQATAVPVRAGLTTAGIDIAAAPRPVVSIYDGGVYAYFNDNAVAIKPAPINMFAGPTTVVASAVGLGSNGGAPGLRVQMIGDSL